MSTGAFASISPVTASQRCSAARAWRRLASSIRSQVRRMLPSLTRGAASFWKPRAREIAAGDSRPSATSRSPRRGRGMRRTRSFRADLLEVAQVFSRLEANRVAGRNRDLDSRLGVASDAALAALDLEDPEAPQLDAIARS